MPLEDSELIRLAQGGDMDAFEQLVVRHDRNVLSLAAQYVASADDAKDIYQEVFLRVYRNIRRFQFRSEFSTWLHRITVNVCLTHAARRKRSEKHRSMAESDDEEGNGEVLADAESLPDRRAEDAQLGGQIEEALLALSPKQNMVFTLRHQQGYKIREIATMMDCTTGTVKRYLFTATRRMREHLKDYIE